MNLNAVETPAILINDAIARRNISRFQTHCDKKGLSLRPHIKTHKLPYYAHLQIEAGAKGITCQKIGEAEIMANAGIDDILITFNIIGDKKLERLRKLARRLKTFKVTVDSHVIMEGLSRAFADEPRPLTVMVECDTGAGRCGVQTPQQAAILSEAIANARGLRFGGLMTYPPVGGGAAVDRFMSEANALLKQKGIACEVISGGGSPDMWHAGDSGIVTEYRAGTYIYNDRSLVERGVCGWEDCALTVLATIVSTPIPNRAIIDAGSKALTSDLLGLDGFGYVIEQPDAKIVSLSEEHGIIESDKPRCFSVGDKISIIPNHVCVVSNLFDYAWISDETGQLKKTEIAARGKVT